MDWMTLRPSYPVNQAKHWNLPRSQGVYDRIGATMRRGAVKTRPPKTATPMPSNINTPQVATNGQLPS